MSQTRRSSRRGTAKKQRQADRTNRQTNGNRASQTKITRLPDELSKHDTGSRHATHEPHS